MNNSGINIVPKSQLRERSVNYVNSIKNLIDSYPETVSHGIQKDAIQNGWDARLKKDQKFIYENWKYEFELIENFEGGHDYLIMQDYGTCGLTGDMIGDDIGEVEDPPQEERWARWEALAWNKESPSELGARGQGKMILTAGSTNYHIIYDSLRKNLSYRMGATQATKSGFHLYHFDGEEGKKHLLESFNLAPIDHVGTRVIIVNPNEELVLSIKNGDFLAHIEETWWPIIFKYGVKIVVKHGGNEHVAQVPDLFPIEKESKQTPNFKSWYKENSKISFQRKNYKINKLCIGYNPSAVPTQYQGVAVFRGGMKITSVEFVNKDMREKIYGYVELDESVGGLSINCMKLSYPIIMVSRIRMFG